MLDVSGTLSVSLSLSRPCENVICNLDNDDNLDNLQSQQTQISNIYIKKILPKAQRTKGIESLNIILSKMVTKSTRLLFLTTYCFFCSSVNNVAVKTENSW